jgi:formylglycine-generating enzyme required for sulfatase activity
MRMSHWIVLGALFPCIFSLGEHNGGSGSRSVVPSAETMTGVPRVVERQAGSLQYTGELGNLEALSAQERVGKLRRVLAGTEWVCREGKVERGVDAVAALLRGHPEWEKELAESREKSLPGDREVLVEYLSSAATLGGAKILSGILALTREMAAIGSEQEQTVFTLLMENSGWMPERSELALSYLAESAKEPVKEPALSHRRTALLRLAVSGSEMEREIFRQLVFGLPPDVFADLQKFAKEKIPASDGCEWMRLGQKTKDLLQLVDESDLAGPILSRIIQERDPSLDLAQLLEKHPALHDLAVPHLLAMEEHRASRAKELGTKLSPNAQQLLSTMRPHKQGQEIVKSSILPPPPAPAPAPKLGNRPKPPTTAADTSELLQEPAWYCGKWGWDSDLAVAHAALEADPKLKQAFIRSNEKIAGSELGQLLQHWQAGEMNKSELVARLEQHSDRYWVTDSAKKAREIVIGLETDLELKTYLQEEHERVTKGVKGKAVLSPEWVVSLGARAQSVVMRMPKANRDQLLGELSKAVSADERATIGCVVPVIGQLLKSRDLAALALHEAFPPIPPMENLLSFVKVEPGEFWMGAKMGLKNQVYHQVKITKPFELQTTEVSQALYEKVMKTNPSAKRGILLPVTDVSYSDAKAFIAALNAHPINQTATGKRKYLYRLPSEAQWEYAARGGQNAPKENTLYSHGDDEKSLSEYAHYGSRTGPSQVGKKKPTALGLYDIHGNVWERVEDGYSPDASEAEFDEAYGSPVKHTGRGGVVRGGGWDSKAEWLSSAHRLSTGSDGRNSFTDHDVGFRLERTPIP